MLPECSPEKDIGVAETSLCPWGHCCPNVHLKRILALQRHLYVHRGHCCLNAHLKRILALQRHLCVHGGHYCLNVHLKRILALQRHLYVHGVHCWLNAHLKKDIGVAETSLCPLLPECSPEKDWRCRNSSVSIGDIRPDPRSRSPNLPTPRGKSSVNLAEQHRSGHQPNCGGTVEDLRRTAQFAVITRPEECMLYKHPKSDQTDLRLLT